MVSRPLASLVLVSLLAVTAPACAPVEGGDGDLSDLEAPGGDKADGTESDPLADELRAKYGVRPRRYTAFFDGDTAGEVDWLAALEPVTAELSARLSGPFAGLDLLEPELATNFIVEGGYFALKEGVTSDIESFYHLGLDMIVPHAGELRPLLGEDLYAWITDPVNQYTETNEQGTRVTGVWFANMHDALTAAGAMFLWSRRAFVADLRAQGGDPASLSDAAWFFWTTVYFNGGPGAGRSALTQHGVGWWQTRWTKADDASKYGNVIQFNALWRTASYEYLSATQYE